MFFDRYESKDVLEQYIKTQYGTLLKEPYLKSESFYQEILSEATAYVQNAVALDAGCALGRLVFEYEKLGAERSIGIDTSRQFIRYCEERKTQRTEFVCGDIVHAKFQKESFDFISAINLVDRVKSPQRLVETFGTLLKSGGVLLLADPYDWQLSPAPAMLHVGDMKELCGDSWEVIRERRDVEYITPVGGGQERIYREHVLVLRKA